MDGVLDIALQKVAHIDRVLSPTKELKACSGYGRDWQVLESCTASEQSVVIEQAAVA